MAGAGCATRLERGRLLEVATQAATAIGPAILHLFVQPGDNLGQRGTDGMVRRTGGKVRSRSHQMHLHVEGRAGLQAVLQGDAGLVDLATLNESPELLFKMGDEGGRGLMIEVLYPDFHR